MHLLTVGKEKSAVVSAYLENVDRRKHALVSLHSAVEAKAKLQTITGLGAAKVRSLDVHQIVGNDVCRLRPRSSQLSLSSHQQILETLMPLYTNPTSGAGEYTRHPVRRGCQVRLHTGRPKN